MSHRLAAVRRNHGEQEQYDSLVENFLPWGGETQLRASASSATPRNQLRAAIILSTSPFLLPSELPATNIVRGKESGDKAYFGE